MPRPNGSLIIATKLNAKHRSNSVVNLSFCVLRTLTKAAYNSAISYGTSPQNPKFNSKSSVLPNKYARPPFLLYWLQNVKKYSILVASSAMNFTLNLWEMI